MIIRKAPRMKIGKTEKTESTKGTLENIVRKLNMPKMAPPPIPRKDPSAIIRKPSHTHKSDAQMRKAVQRS